MPEEVKAKKQGGHEWCGCCSCLAALGVIPALLIAIAFLAISTFVQPLFNLVSCPVGLLSQFARTQNIQLPLINQNLPLYQTVAKTIGIPWELLAAIHYREHKLNTSSPNADGPMQISPNTWNNSIVPGIKRDYGITLTDRTDFEQALWGAAYYLKKGVGALTDQKDINGNYLVSENDLQRAMKFYNTGIDKDPGLWSYVMNNFSLEHVVGKLLHWITKNDANDGAFTVYSLLTHGAKNPDGTIAAIGDCITATPGGDAGGLAPPSSATE